MKKSDQIRHNLYIIRMIMKVSPSRVWMTMLYEVLTNVYNILFTVVFLPTSCSVLLIKSRSAL